MGLLATMMSGTEPCGYVSHSPWPAQMTMPTLTQSNLFEGGRCRYYGLLARADSVVGSYRICKICQRLRSTHNLAMTHHRCNSISCGGKYRNLENDERDSLRLSLCQIIMSDQMLAHQYFHSVSEETVQQNVPYAEVTECTTHVTGHDFHSVSEETVQQNVPDNEVTECTTHVTGHENNCESRQKSGTVRDDGWWENLAEACFLLGQIDGVKPDNLVRKQWYRQLSRVNDPVLEAVRIKDMTQFLSQTGYLARTSSTAEASGSAVEADSLPGGITGRIAAQVEDELRRIAADSLPDGM